MSFLQAPTVVTVDPPPSSGTMWNRCGSATTGGGTSTVCDVSPFDPDLVAWGHDTCGVRYTRDGGTNVTAWPSGLVNTGLYKSDGLYWSRKVPGRLFITTGNGNASASGLYVCDGLDGDAPTTWVKLSGTGTNPGVVFDGTINVPNVLGPGVTYPRHHSGLCVDEDTAWASGQTYVYAASGDSAGDGVWRWQVDIGPNSGDAATASCANGNQVRIGNTAGKYAMTLCLMQNDVPGSTKRLGNKLFIGIYDGSNVPTSAVGLWLCSNATAASPTAAVISGTVPKNVTAMTYLFGTGTSAQEVLIVCTGDIGSSSVWWCLNPNAATPTFSQYTGGPATDSAAWLLTCDLTESADGSTYKLMTGCTDALGSGGAKRMMWYGTWPCASTPNNTNVTWTARNTWNVQVMNAPSGHAYWLDHHLTYADSGASGVAQLRWVPKTSKMFMAGRSCGTRTDDDGATVYPVNTASASGGYGVAIDTSGLAGRKYRAYWPTVDFPGCYSTGGFGASTPDDPLTQPLISYDASGFLAGKQVFNVTTPFIDPAGGEIFAFGGFNDATGVPDRLTPASDQSLSLYGFPWSGFSSFSNADGHYGTIGVTDYNFTGGSTNHYCGSVGIVCYFNGDTTGTRIIVAVARQGGGVWYKAGAGAWTQVSGGVGVGGSGFDIDSIDWDRAHNAIYLLERKVGTVWRIPITDATTLGTAVGIFSQTLTTPTTRADCVGFLAVDPSATSATRLWVSTTTNLYWIDNADTVAASTGTTRATSTYFTTAFPGEVPGWVLATADGIVHMGTNAVKGSAWNYPRNGSVGARLLHLTKPMATGSSFTYVDSADSLYHGGCSMVMQAAMPQDGSYALLTGMGGGLNSGLWRVST